MSEIKLKPMQVWEISIECSLLTCVLLSKDKYTEGQQHDWDGKGYHRTDMTEGEYWCVASSYKGMGATHHFLTEDEIVNGIGEGFPKGKYLGYVIDYDTGKVLQPNEKGLSNDKT